MLQADIQNTCGWWLFGLLGSDGLYVGRKIVPMGMVALAQDKAYDIAGHTFSPDEALAWIKHGELP